jgi:hypothetical protein
VDFDKDGQYNTWEIDCELPTGAGVDYKRMSFRVGYFCEAGRFTARRISPEYISVSLFKCSSFQITVGVSF